MIKYRLAILSLLFLASCSDKKSKPDNESPIKQSDYNGDLIPMEKEGVWGFADTNQNFIIQPEYAEVDLFINGSARVKKDDKWFMLDSKGEKIQLSYDMISPFNNGYLVKNGKMYGYLDKKGKSLGKPAYSSATHMKNGSAWVEFDDKHNLINSKGEPMLPWKYDSNYAYYSGHYFSNGLLKVEHEGEFGYIDMNNDTVISPQFEDALDFSEDLAWVMNDGKWGAVNKKGQNIIERRFQYVTPFESGLAPVLYNDKWGILKSDASWSTQPEFDFVYRIGSERFAFVTDDTWEIGNSSGQLFSSSEFDFIGQLSENLAVVKKGDKWGYLSKKGELTIECRYENAKPFIGDYAFVKKGGKWLVINKKGKEFLAQL